MTRVGRGRLVGSRRGARPGARASGTRWTTSTCWGTSATPPCSSATTTPQQHFYSYALSRAREAGRRDGGRLLRCSGCASATSSPATASAVRSSAEEALALGGEHRPAGPDRPSARLARPCSPPSRAATTTTTCCATSTSVVAAHPLGILTDPVHDLTRWAKGVPRRRRRRHLRRPAPPAPAPAPRRWRGWPPPSASTPPSAPTRPRPGPRLGRGARRVRRGHRTAVGARHGRLRAGDDRRARARPRRCSRRRWPTTRGPVARSTRLAPSWPTASGCAAASAASTPASTCASALETFEDLRAEPLADAREPGAARLRRDRPQARPLHAGEADPDGAQDRPAGELGAVEQGRRRPVLGLARGRWPSTCATSSPRPASPRAASSPSSTSADARLRPAHPGHLTGVSNRVRGHARQQCTTTHCESETAMSVDIHPTDRATTHRRRRAAPTSGPVARIVAGSLAAGAATALVLTLVVFAGATESVITGSMLAGASGSAGRCSRVLSARLHQPAPALGRASPPSR